MLLEQSVQDVGLHERARVSLEDETFRPLRLLQFPFDELHDDLVGHQLAALVEAGDAPTDIGAALDLFVEHRPCRHIFEAVSFGHGAAL